MNLASTLKSTHSASWKPFWKLVDRETPWVIEDVMKLRAVLEKCCAIRDHSALHSNGIDDSMVTECEEISGFDLDGVVIWWSLIFNSYETEAICELLNTEVGDAVFNRMRLLFAETTGESGFYLVPRMHRLYIIAEPDSLVVKVGLTHRGDVRHRRDEIAKRSKLSRLDVVADLEIGPMQDQEAEHVEWSVRHFLNVRHGFSHSGKVDWMIAPATLGGSWQELLEEATKFVLLMKE